LARTKRTTSVKGNSVSVDGLAAEIARNNLHNGDIKISTLVTA
jgi:hypothetical protein